MPSHADALKAERDELLAALKAINGLARWHVRGDVYAWVAEVRRIARQAILNAEATPREKAG